MSRNPYRKPRTRPIITQPQPRSNITGSWMTLSENTPFLPDQTGLQYLTNLEELLIDQKIESLEPVVGFERKIKYVIYNSVKQKVFYVADDSDNCSRMWFGPIRSADLKILDNLCKVIIHLHRPLKCAACCFPCCLQRMIVSAPPGIPIGYIHQEWSLKPNLAIKNADGETVLRVIGPFCTCSCGNDANFRIVSLNGEEVGRIIKQWSGCCHEMCTDADSYKLVFSVDFHVELKAILVGALFLIDLTYYEESARNRWSSLGKC